MTEVRLKARTEAGLPCNKTFAKFGNKQERAAKLRDFCLNRAGFEDVAAICAGVAERAETTAESESRTSGETAVGFVYLLKSGRFYKIGRTNAVGRRERELAIQLPEAAKTVHSIRTDDPKGIEKSWHDRFSQRRKNGEWFELKPDDVAAFKRRRFM